MTLKVVSKIVARIKINVLFHVIKFRFYFVRNIFSEDTKCQEHKMSRKLQEFAFSARNFTKGRFPDGLNAQIVS